MLDHFRITVCGIEELKGFSEARVSHVLSILDPEAPTPPAFGSFGEHARLELRFHDVIEETEGMIAPRAEDVRRILDFGRTLVREPPEAAHLLVHCHAGISRSTAAMTLLLAQSLPDRPAADLLEEVFRIRAKAWPNLRIMELGDAMLGRDGTLVVAAHAMYRRQIEIRPHIADLMANGGRAREVTAARAVPDNAWQAPAPVSSPANSPSA